MAAEQPDSGGDGFFFIRRRHATEKMILGKDIPLVVGLRVVGHACKISVASGRRSVARKNCVWRASNRRRLPPQILPASTLEVSFYKVEWDKE